jgi:hypothetical protein
MLRVIIIPALAISTIASAADRTIPDPALVDRAIRVDSREAACGTCTKELRHWSRGRDATIFVRHGVPMPERQNYELLASQTRSFPNVPRSHWQNWRRRRPA